MDRIAASKVYAKDAYTQHNPWKYYLLGREHAPLHRKTRGILELLLQILDQYGEKEMVRFIRKKVIPYQNKWDNPEIYPKLLKRFRKEYNIKQ